MTDLRQGLVEELAADLAASIEAAGWQRAGLVADQALDAIRQVTAWGGQQVYITSAGKPPSPRSQSFFGDFAAAIAHALQLLAGAQGPQAHRTAEVAIDAFRRRWADERIYLPLPRPDLAARNQEIFRRYSDGATVSTLAREYQICSIQVYKIIGALRGRRGKAHG